LINSDDRIVNELLRTARSHSVAGLRQRLPISGHVGR
jgi:hypothetical protein